ncbi:MAG: T9SS type A sorting domain-containing protein [Ferruginibacter sp.]
MLQFRLVLFFAFLLSVNLKPLCAQRSLLINFGGSTCGPTYLPSFSMIKDPLATTPALIANCNLQNQMPNYFAVFVAYNPENNKVYIADIRTGTQTNIWVLDVGLPGSIGCPATIPVNPTYAYNYVSNNFEFDNNGDLWSFSNYNPSTGQCNFDKFDVNTGQVINTRVLQFPAGNFPSTISSGDLCILPNGRLFAVLGSPSKLYEITNYSGTTSATATFLTNVPKDCYGIAYLNGVLELAGNDFQTNCYYFDYNIITGALGTEKPFQVGNSPVDNTSISPSIGCTKRLVGAAAVNSNTYDLVYELYVRNMGNVILNNLQLQDDLAATFGAGNVSNVTASFVAGSNSAGLSINPSYNGTTVTSLLANAQTLPNRINNSTNYFATIRINCRVTNIQPQITYLNRAVTRADIGAASLTSILTVTDTSNNGTESLVDPNQNGNANETGENEPTPFGIGALPVRFLDISASMKTNQDAQIQWRVATPMVNAALFNVEYSKDTKQWQSIGSVSVTDPNQSVFQFIHQQVPKGMAYYRIRQEDLDGQFIYSRIVHLSNKRTSAIHIYPNPSTDYLTIDFTKQSVQKRTIQLVDPLGRTIYQTVTSQSILLIPVAAYRPGLYILRVVSADETMTQSVQIQSP